MAFELKDRESYNDRNVYDLLKFLNNKMDSEEKAYGFTTIDPMGYTTLSVLYDENQTLYLESPEEVATYLLLDTNKLLRMGYKKVNAGEDPMIVKFTLYPEADRLIVRTGKGNEIGKRVFIYYAGGSKIHEEEESLGYRVRKRIPRIAKLSDVIATTSVSQLINRGDKEKGYVPEELLHFEEEQAGDEGTGITRKRRKRGDK